MFLNDHETATDLLYYEAIAKTVVRLIRQTPDVPITIGVHGDWGAGKSSVLKMTETAFAGAVDTYFAFGSTGGRSKASKTPRQSLSRPSSMKCVAPVPTRRRSRKRRRKS